jgi:hypothetical protein
MHGRIADQNIPWRKEQNGIRIYRSQTTSTELPESLSVIGFRTVMARILDLLPSVQYLFQLPRHLLLIYAYTDPAGNT